jgi:iron complex outermembrane recepter protein
MRLRRGLTMVGWWLVLVTDVASAESGATMAQGELPVVTLPPIVVIGPARLPLTLPRSWVPNSMDIVPGAEVGGVKPSRLPEVLERLPGVTIQDEQGNTHQPDLALRGFTASPVTGLPQGLSVYLDGVRLNEPTAEEVNFDLIPMEAVERVEVIRGASVLFGRNALGGAVNLVTRRGGQTPEVFAELSGGSFGRREMTLGLGGGAGPFDYHASVSDSREDGWRDFGSSRLSHAFGKLGFRRGPTDLTLSYQYGNDRIEQPGSLPESVLRAHRSANFTAGDFFAPELHLAILNARQEVGEHWTLQVNGFVRALDSEQFNVNLITASSRLRNDVLSAGGTLQATHRRSISGRDNVLILGVEATHHAVRSRTFEEASETRALEANLADSQYAAGAFVQDSLVLLRDAPLQGSTIVLTVAGRWDWLRHGITDRLGGASGGVDEFSRLNPRAGLNVNLNDRAGVFASYAEAFRAPAFLELTCAGPGAVCPGLQVGAAPDPRLRPVVARTYELGVRARPLDRVETDVTGFWTNVEDDIFSASPAGTTGVFFQNVGRTRRQGVEVSVRAWTATTVEARVSYTFTRATFQDRAELATPLTGTEVVRPGDSFALAPRHRVNVGVVYRPWRWATLSGDVGYVGSEFLRGDEVNRQAPLPGYTFVNAGAAARWRGFEAFLRVNNVLDDRHETFGTYARNPRLSGSPVERFLTPAAPINATAGLRATF